jgi:hypothetical protein
VLASSIKRKPSATTKRKRDSLDNTVDPVPQAGARKNRDGPKKKKASRACFHCQKAHLTCDDCTFYAVIIATLADKALLYSSSMSALHQARYRQQLHGRAP